MDQQVLFVITVLFHKNWVNRFISVGVHAEKKENIDYVIESATYGFLFTSCKTLENERVSAANE